MLNMWEILAVLLSCALFIFVLVFLCRKREKSAPGPAGYPFIGIFFQIRDLSVFHKVITAIGKNYGRMFQFRLLGRKAVVLRSASVVRSVFHGPECVDRSEPFFQAYVLNNKSMAFAELRKDVESMREVFIKAVYGDWKTRESHDLGLDHVITKAIRSLGDTGGENTDPDLVIKSMMAQLFSSKLIGETLPDDHPDSNSLWDFIDLLYAMLDPRIDMPLKTLPVLRHLPGKYGRIFRATITARDRVARAYFDSHKDTFKEGRIRGLVDACLQIQADDIKDTGTSWLTDDYIKGIMNDTCIAGMTEMMKSIRMLILLMCHYQDIQARVIEEINDVIGNDVRPCPEHRKQMPYTEAVLNEMLRYVSQTPLAIPHKCNQDIEVDGYLIQKNSGVFPNIWGIHHDEDVWGDPWEFRPERFLDDNGNLLPETHPCRISLIPFSVGKRRCPGEQFAMSRIFLIFTSLIQQLQFLPPEGVDLPSADPRLYNTKYPLRHPKFTCRVVSRAGLVPP